MNNKLLKTVTGVAALVLTAAILITLFSVLVLSPDNPNYMISETDDNKGWSYTVLIDGKAQSANAVTVNEYTTVLDCENFSALCMTTTLTEELDGTNSISIFPSTAGTEVYADDYLLYSNINYDKASAVRDENGFLTFAEGYQNSAVTASDSVDIPIDMEYAGAEFKIYTYYNDEVPFYNLSYPLFSDIWQSGASFSISTVMPTIIAVLSALAALTICVIFIVRAKASMVSFRLLLVALFFVFSTISSLSSLFYYSSILKNITFDIPPELYVLPVIFYFALNLSRWRKTVLLSLSVAITLFLIYYTVVLLDEDVYYDSTSELILSFYFLAVIILLITELVLARGRHARLLRLRTIPVVAGILVVSVIVSAANSDTSPLYLFPNIFNMICAGSTVPLNNFLCMFFAVSAMVLIVAEFAWEYSEHKKENYVLNERSRHAINSYNMLLASVDETKAARHEMNHHIDAILTLLQNGESERAKAYAAQVSSGLQSLPVVKYCDNLIINSITGAYAGRAKSENIRFECSASVPEKIGIEDADLCVFLENMFDNALEACRKATDKNKVIKVDIKAVKSFLFISCQNTYENNVKFDESGIPVTTKENSESHGYGLSAMKSVAEKYDSILVFDLNDNMFSVKTNLTLEKSV